MIERYQEMKTLYERVLFEDGPHLGEKLEDTGGSYMLNGSRFAFTIELPEGLRSGMSSHVNLMAPLAEEKTEIGMIECLLGLMKAKAYLCSEGYDVPDSPVAEWSAQNRGSYADGVEYVFKIPTESEDDLVKMVRAFDKLGGEE